MRRRFLILRSNDIAEKYLTIEALEDGLIARLSRSDCEYCIDGSGDWKPLGAENNTESINTGQILSFRGNIIPTGFGGIGTFSITKSCNIMGNSLSMLYRDDAMDIKSIRGKTYAFYRLFAGCSVIKKVSANFLPATALEYNCYDSMFYGCTSLTTAPELPVTTLANGCYSSMFYGCTSLTQAPELPATTLADSCYSSMFRGCTSLTQAPELPATTLADSCYTSMFRGCTSLTQAPELPATTLADSCYTSMLQECIRLTTAPELPATTLADYCYYSMFRGCSTLNYIKALFTTTPSSSYTLNWVLGVASTGTFVKNPDAKWDVVGDSGVPRGWTVKFDGEEDGGG